MVARSRVGPPRRSPLFREPSSQRSNPCEAYCGQLTNSTTFDVGLTRGYDGTLLKDVTWSGPISGNVHRN